MEEKHCKWYNDEFCTNGDSPCVADYCPVVEYPELCKHRERDKDINVRSKLTDEEIVKALERCIDESMGCVGCPYRGNSCRQMDIDTLDLIHRLQSENAELKEDNERWEAVFKICEERKYRKMFNEEWKKKYQKELDKQGEGLIAGSPDFDYVYKRYFEQKAEIERLKSFIDFKTANVMCDKCKEKAVKDTAKEIFGKIFKDCWVLNIELEYPLMAKKIIESIAKEYGVEVE